MATRANTDRTWLSRLRTKARLKLGVALRDLAEPIEALNAAVDELVEAESGRHRARIGKSRDEMASLVVRMEAARQSSTTST